MEHRIWSVWYGFLTCKLAWDWHRRNDAGRNNSQEQIHVWLCWVQKNDGNAARNHRRSDHTPNDEQTRSIIAASDPTNAKNWPKFPSLDSERHLHCSSLFFDACSSILAKPRPRANGNAFIDGRTGCLPPLFPKVHGTWLRQRQHYYRRLCQRKLLQLFGHSSKSTRFPKHSRFVGLKNSTNLTRQKQERQTEGKNIADVCFMDKASVTGRDIGKPGQW